MRFFYNGLDHSLLVYIVIEVLILIDLYADKLFVGCIGYLILVFVEGGDQESTIVI